MSVSQESESGCVNGKERLQSFRFGAPSLRPNAFICENEQSHPAKKESENVCVCSSRVVEKGREREEEMKFCRVLVGTVSVFQPLVRSLPSLLLSQIDAWLASRSHLESPQLSATPNFSAHKSHFLPSFLPSFSAEEADSREWDMLNAKEAC